MPRVKNASIVNEHGVRISEAKVSKIKKAFDKYNRTVDKEYRSLTAKGISSKIARMIAGHPLELNFDAFKSSKSIGRVIDALKYRTTSAYRIKARGHIENSLMAFLEQRVGLGPQALRRVQAVFRAMTMKEYYQWLNKNWEYIEELFENYKNGIFNAIYNESDSRGILEKIMGGSRKWRMPKDIYK